MEGVSSNSLALRQRHWRLWNQKIVGGSNHEQLLSNGVDKEHLVTIPLNDNEGFEKCVLGSHHRDSISASTTSSTTLMSETSSNYDSCGSEDDDDSLMSDEDDTAGVFSFSINLSSTFLHASNTNKVSSSGLSERKPKQEEEWGNQMDKEEFAMIASSILTDAIIQ